MVLQGDKAYTVTLLKDLTAIFLVRGRLTSLNCEEASNELKSLFVEVRRRNQQFITSITNRFSFLRVSGLLDWRLNLDRAVQLAAMVMIPCPVCYADVDMSLSCAMVPKKVLFSSIFACQSYVSFAKFASDELLTKGCLEKLKCGVPELPNGKNVMDDASCLPRSSLYVHGHCDLYREFRDSFGSYHLEQVSDRRRCAGLGLYSTTSSPNKLQAAIGSLQSEVVSGVVARWILGTLRLMFSLYLRSRCTVHLLLLVVLVRPARKGN